MMRPANLAAAIEVLRQQKGDLGTLTLWPDRVNAELITRRDNEPNVVLTYDGELARATRSTSASRRTRSTGT